jgi:hypothetical protein
MVIGLWSSIPYLTAIVAMGWLCRNSYRRNERCRHSALPSIVGAIALAVAGLYRNQLGIALPAITLCISGRCGQASWRKSIKQASTRILHSVTQDAADDDASL